MIVSDLKVDNLRNLSTVHLSLNSQFNLIVGPNGSGKTALLEAMYLVTCGHSFRTRELGPLITHNQSSLTVFAKSLENETISIQKSAYSPTQIKVDNVWCSSTSQLAYILPCQVIYSDLFQIIDAGPSERRSVLDWGLFHVKHVYLGLLKNYKKILKQRNALLKTPAPYNQFIPWDIQLCQIASEIDNLRRVYFNDWFAFFIKVLKELSPVVCTLEYYKGWDKKDEKKSFQDILKESFESDKYRTYTQYGPHQADILINTEATKAKHYLSRGQQKIVLIAMKLAQKYFIEKDCLYLFDDFSAELDDFHQEKLLNYLQQSKGQYFLTSPKEGLITELLSASSCSTFNLTKVE